jgi:uncharacterized membrane protein
MPEFKPSGVRCDRDLFLRGPKPCSSAGAIGGDDIAIKALSPAINDPTTAVRAIDQIEDLFTRLSKSTLDAEHVRDGEGNIRVIVPMPTWDDSVSLAFDEIRQYGAGSIQVARRLRAALTSMSESLAPDRVPTLHRHLAHLDAAVERTLPDAQDQAMASQADRQGIGLARRRDESSMSTRKGAPG